LLPSSPPPPFSYLAPKPAQLLRLQHISLFQFKNYRQDIFTFDHKITGICGSNGVGKTNLLDAVYYLCFTRSYFSKSDQQSVQKGCSGFRIEGRFHKNGNTEKVTCVLRETGRKEFSLNDEAYPKFSGHIGRFPCVMIAPDDVELITGSSEQRRKYIDTLLSQLNPDYLLLLIDYNKILQQRNSLLRSFAESRSRNLALLDVLDAQLQQTGVPVFEIRKQFLTQLIPLVQQHYQRISSGETAELQYQSQLLQQSFNLLLQENREKDLMLLRSNTGIHKDELEMRLAGEPFRSIASQGQRKSLLFALKLAEFDMLHRQKGFPPILLLDDVFEKLDAERMHNLLDWVCTQNEAQLFITDTHHERLQSTLEALQTDYKILRID
jgi:DNA replication and repair protein RecF